MQNELPRHYDFKALEERAQQKWTSHNVIKKTISYEPEKELFSFLEGPPTANAPPALHHTETRVMKDAVCRYHYMLGKTVPRKGGWDTHGLPVEVQLEKKLGIKNKKAIEEYGIEKFVETCRSDVFAHIQEWNKFTEKLAYWVDLEHPYITYDNNYIESIWWSIKELHQRGYLYEGFRTTPFCPRCQTSLSSAEVALGYKTVKDNTVFVTFSSTKHKNRYYLAWTTTPWTLPGNVALAVHPSVEYAVVEKDEKEFVLAKELVGKYFGANAKIKHTIVGKELEGETYVPLFDTYLGKKLNGKFAVVQTAEFVTTTDGTGIVHIAPGFGEDDYNLGQEKKLAFVQHVMENGLFTEDVKEFAGMNAKHSDSKVISHLKEKGLVFKEEVYEHEYPFCWRCDTALMYYATKSWYVNVSKHRHRMIQFNQSIHWEPEHIKEGRFGEWIANAKDWGFSRTRYWGTPLPIWKCEKCTHIEVIGSVAELKEKGKNIPAKLDLHKPYVDGITLTCEKCTHPMKREPYVMDVWYDSGSAPFAQLHYPFENKELFETFFPYHYIAEAIDQTRGWFYHLHVLATLLFDSYATKSIVCAGHLVDKQGQKMSKSKGNVINPNEVFEKYGVDALRLQMCLTPAGDSKRIGMDSFKESVQPMLTILWNSLQFAIPLLEKGKALLDREEIPPLQKEDAWLLSRLADTHERVTNGLENYYFHECTRALLQFVNEDLSRNYIKWVRERAKEEDAAVAYTFYQTFHILSQLLAPLAPYISEAMYEACKGNEKSVHLTRWPKSMERNTQLEQSMRIAQEVIASGLSLREKIKMPVRWPLATLNIRSQKGEIVSGLQQMQGIVLQQLNVKQLTFNQKTFEAGMPLPSDGEGMLSLDTQMTPELEAEGFARELTRKVQELRKQAKTNSNDLIEVHCICSPHLQRIIKSQLHEMQEKVRAREWVFVGELKGKPLAQIEENIRDEKVVLGIYLIN